LKPVGILLNGEVQTKLAVSLRSRQPLGQKRIFRESRIPISVIRLICCDGGEMETDFEAYIDERKLELPESRLMKRGND